MAVVTYGTIKTNLEPGTDLYDYLTEINQRIGGSDLIITCETLTKGFWRKREEHIYRAYWDLGNGEYQVIMAASGYEGTIEAYLIGILTGLDKVNQEPYQGL